jgi:hypothetical protein
MKIQSIAILAAAPFIAARNPIRVRKGAATRRSSARQLQNNKDAPAPDAAPVKNNVGVAEPVKEATPDDALVKEIENGEPEPPVKEMEVEAPVKEEEGSMPEPLVLEEELEEVKPTVTEAPKEEESVDELMSMPELVETITETTVAVDTTETVEMSMPEWGMSVAEGVDDQPIVVEEGVDDQPIYEVVDEASPEAEDAGDGLQFIDAVVEEEDGGSGSVMLGSSLAAVVVTAAIMFT